jgi:hypothetical protein
MRLFSAALFVNAISVEAVVVAGERKFFSWSQLREDSSGVGPIETTGGTREARGEVGRNHK